MDASEKVARRLYAIQVQLERLGRSSQLGNTTIGGDAAVGVTDVVGEAVVTNDAMPDVQGDAADGNEGVSDLQAISSASDDDLIARFEDAAADREDAAAEILDSLQDIAAAFGEDITGLSDRVDNVIVGAGITLLLYSDEEPEGTAPTGSTWFMINAAEDIVGQWQQTGTYEAPVWTPRRIASEVFANVDVGKLTAGQAAILDLVAMKIAASTANLQTVNVGNLFVTEGATMPQAVIDYLFAKVVQAKQIVAEVVQTSQSGTRVEIRNDSSDRGHVYFYDSNDALAGDIQGVPAPDDPPEGASARQNGLSFAGDSLFIGDVTIANPGTGPASVQMQAPGALFDTVYVNEIRDPKTGRVVVGQATGVTQNVLKAMSGNPVLGQLGYATCTWQIVGATCEVKYSIYFRGTPAPGSGRWYLELPIPAVMPAGVNYTPILTGRYDRNGSNASGFAVYGDTDGGNLDRIAYLSTDTGTRLTGSLPNLAIDTDRLLLLGHYQIA
ncbi:hypothetical protein ITJ50_00950 [Curtobacterium sp. VKM Ac-2889]|uniref:hypothetical protein n=1 Tax=unclassified Curtobacterium TaxID=257496 RepID=UPI001889E1AF|nr:MULTISPECIES: hypothetical protein [unclassified Curtobacterium]MBF4597170.1 hypothetical protein [Curtobacterium sp. VKM Ac-1796]MBF4609786.1 hypothetical protein [Curtobacterium sp. VKM Ac-2889]